MRELCSLVNKKGILPEKEMTALLRRTNSQLVENAVIEDVADRVSVKGICAVADKDEEGHPLESTICAEVKIETEYSDVSVIYTGRTALIKLTEKENIAK